MADKLYEVTLDGGGPWGFRLQGGKDFGTPLKVARITPGSKAAVKKVNPGDVILEINGSAIDGLTHMDAQNVIKNSGSVLQLKLKSCGNVKVLEQTEVIHSAGVDHKFNAKPRAFGFGASTSPASTTPSYQSTPSQSAPRSIVSAPKFSPGEYAQKKKEELENRKNQQSKTVEDSEVLRMLKESNLSDEQKRARKQSGSFQKLETGLSDNNGGAHNDQTFKMVYEGRHPQFEVPGGSSVIEHLKETQRMEKSGLSNEGKVPSRVFQRLQRSLDETDEADAVVEAVTIPAVNNHDDGDNDDDFEPPDRQTSSTSITIQSKKHQPGIKSHPTSTSTPQNADVFRMTYNGPSMRQEVPEGTHVISDLRQRIEEEDARALARAKAKLAHDTSDRRGSEASEETEPDIDEVRHDPGIYKGSSNPSKLFKYLQYKCGEVDGVEASVVSNTPNDFEAEVQLDQGRANKTPIVPSQAFQMLQRITKTEDLPPPPPELMGEQPEHVRPSFGGGQGGNQSKTFQKLQTAVAAGESDAHPSVFNRPAQVQQQSSPSSSKYGPKGQTPTAVNPIPKAPMPTGPSFKINAPSARSPTNNFGGGTSPARSPTGYQPPPGMPVSSPPQMQQGSAAQKIGIRPIPQQVPAKVDTKNPVCAKCTENIMGPFVSAIGKTWHPDHFACASCATSLQNQGFVEEQGQLYCERCYNEFFAPKCATCGKSVVGNCVNAIGKAFHPEHFVCASCGKSFGNQGFLVDSGHPYCEGCYDQSFGVKCASCQKSISGGEKYVEAMDKNFHSTCFNCDICHVRLEGNSFFQSGGRTFCAQHKNGN